MIAGGFDDISEENSYEFANTMATSNVETEFAVGREPTEMSRPATATRSGAGPLTYVLDIVDLPALRLISWGHGELVYMSL
jgi:hypothetical protein